jgi:hypothetical protein
MERKMIIAIDFDGTIVYDRWPGIGAPIPGAVKYINQLYDDGHYIIIWTCRTGQKLLDTINYLLNAGVKFHRVNDDEPGNYAQYGAGGRKLYADVYIDDRQVGGLPPWKDIYEAICGVAQGGS